VPPVFRSRIFLGGCLVLAVALCYLPAMSAGFVWDDDLLVTENPLVKGADSLPYIWASSAATDYTPLTTTAFWLQWRLWADNPVGYHFVNILLFALSALLLWRVIELLAIPGAWLGALLFAVHPVNVASVAWIAELKNALSLPLYLAAVACWLRFLDSRKIAPWLLALAATALALLSKGSTVILPLVLLLCLWWKQRRVRGCDLLWLLPFFLLAALGALATIHFQSRLVEAAPAPMPERIARAGHAIWFYLGKDVWPFALCAVYPKWRLDGNFLPLILAAGLAVALWFAQKRLTRGPFFAWAYFIVALPPVLGLVNMSFLDQAYVADWWQQLALPAACALVAAGLTLWPGRTIAERSIAAVFLVLFLCGRTFTDASAYQSMESLCIRTLKYNPDSWTAHDNLGNVYNLDGDLALAAHEYEIALRLKPSDPATHSNLGTVYARLDRLDDAIAQYRAALALAPDSAKYWFNLGNAFRAKRSNAAALDAFTHAVDNNARWISPRYAMGSVLLDLGRPADAGLQAATIMHLDPSSITGHYLMARAAAASSRFDIAVAEAEAALEIAQQSGDAKTILQMQEALAACKSRMQPLSPPP